ncbi:hypothetical protein EON83_25250 [bacterium]|nr:MAG: hypothetical protein EON83_25250 [bacterium]
MFRRFSPARLVTALVIVVLWAVVLSDTEGRETVRQQLHNSLMPSSLKYDYSWFDETRAEERIVRVARDEHKKTRHLVERFPDDAALLAIYVRRSNAFRNFHREGPLLSQFDAWSVQIREVPPVLPPGMGMAMPPGISGGSQSVSPTAKETQEILRLIARGQRLEPQNTYWDWMEMAALSSAGRQNELPRIVKRAVLKSDWDDHVADDMRARTLWNERRQSMFTPAAKTFGYGGVLLHHLSIIRNATRAVAQQVMGLRLQERDDEALQLGLQTVRLARIIRLKANLPITSISAASYERIMIRSARVPLKKRVKQPLPLPTSLLAKNPESLLFLAQQRSPDAAREIASEWGRLNNWGLNSVSGLYGGLISRESLEQVAWTARAANYAMMVAPAAAIIWLLLMLVGWRWNIASVPTSKWISATAVLLPVGLWAFDRIIRAIAVRTNPNGTFFEWVAYKYPEAVLIHPSLLLGRSGLIWSVVAVWLGLFAFYAAFAPHRRTPKQREQKPEDESHPIDMLWNGFKWLLGWRGQMASVWILALTLVAATMLSSPEESNNVARNLFVAVLSLCVWPVAVGIRQMVIFLRTGQRTSAPTQFIAAWRSSLGSFVVVMLVALPVLIWAQSRFERDFNRHFAPIERGQMVAVMQKQRGIPME